MSGNDALPEIKDIIRRLEQNQNKQDHVDSVNQFHGYLRRGNE